MSKLSNNLLNNDDYFEPGAVVECNMMEKVMQDTIGVVQGEVVGFDKSTNLLVLKLPTKSKKDKPMLQVVNIRYVGNAKIIKKAEGKPKTTEKDQKKKTNDMSAVTDKRVRQAEEIRNQLAEAVKKGVSKSGIELYFYLKKMYEETRLRGDSIVVMNAVTIKKPYKKDNISCESNQNNKSLKRICDIVTRFYDEKSSKVSS